MTALVTGAGRGLGRQYAEQLAGMGYDIVLVGRSDNVVNAAEEIEAVHTGVKAMPIILNLAEADAADRLYQMVKDRGLSIDILINNAGMFSFRDIVEVSEESIDGIIYLHDMTMTKLCRLFARDMAERGGGYILNMSSYSVWMPLPGVALYSASKSYVKAFSVAFSKEVREDKVYVTAICPAGIATDLYGLSRKFQDLGVRLGVLMTPERCAKRALRALWRHKRTAVPDWWNCLFIPLLTHLPNWAEKLLRDKTMRFQK